jgi:hypothetical protein
LLVEQQAPRKFEIQDDERALLKSYLDYLGDPRLLLAKHGLSPQQIGLLDKTLAAPATYFNPHATRKFGAVEIMLPRLAQYFDIVPQTIESFKPLEDEINHFKHIRVLLKDIHNLQQKIARVKNYVPTTESFEELARKVQIGEITPQELAARMNEYANSSPAETFDYNGEQLEIRQISQHYYMPLLLTDVEKIAYVNHVIHFESEVRFVRELEAYLKAHAAAFATERRFSFRQVYLDPKRHGENLARDAERLLAGLKQDSVEANLATAGDPLMVENVFDSVSAREVRSLFGERFAVAFDSALPGQWQGPVRSGYGVHLVFLAERTAGGLPPLADVREAVRREWTHARRREASDQFYQALLRKYAVTIETPAAAASKPESVAAR